PGAARGDRGLPDHPGRAGADRAGRGTIEGADCQRGNRALRGSRGIMTTAPELDGIVWHLSSYTYGNGACVEVGWRTSSYSYESVSCVEVAPAPDAVLIRDSKDRTGPALSVPATIWHAFLTTVTR